MTYTFFVPGLPRPGGSKRAFYIKSLGRAIITDDCNNKDWKTAVKWAGKEAIKEPLVGAVAVKCIFVMPRPKAHYHVGKREGELRLGVPLCHMKKPDATKLWRSTEDALTGIAWHDDAQIADQTISKRYGTNIGAEIVISGTPGDALMIVKEKGNE